MNFALAQNQIKLKQWAKRIQERRQSGLTVTQFCKMHGLSKSTYYRWQMYVRKQLLKALPPSENPSPVNLSFVKVPASVPVPVSDPHTVTPSGSLLLHCGVVSLEVNEQTPEGLLRNTLRILQELKLSC